MYERSFDGFVSLCFDIKEKYSGALHISNIHNLNNIISCGNDFNNSHPIRASLNGISIDFFEKIKTENEDIYNNDNIVFNFTSDVSECLFGSDVVVLNSEKILISGKTINVLNEDKLMKKLGVGLPFLVEVNKYLMDYGIVDKYFDSVSELVDDIWK